MADLTDTPQAKAYNPEPPVSDQNQQGYQYAKALCETAKGARGERNFKNNWDYLLGRNHWKSPSTSAAYQIDGWAFKGIVNWTYATIKTKAAMITSTALNLFCDPLDEESTAYDRLLVKSAVEDSFKRVKLDSVKYDAYMWGSVTGVGVSMWAFKPDSLTGAMGTSLTPINTQDFYCDPSADCISSPDCRFVVWEPLLDMSTIRQMWPSKADFVKPDTRQVSTSWDYKSGSEDQSMIYGNAGEYSVNRSNLSSRKARTSFVWIRDESITEDLQKVIIKPQSEGYQCVSCSNSFERGAYPGLTGDSPCPLCGGDMENAQIPAQVQENKVIRRTYPFGRLIVYSGKTLLYDGENPYEIQQVFPFAVYHHDRIPGQFLGQNDVDLLKSLQEAENTVLSMGVDGVVLSMFGPFEYPVSCKSYTDLGNGPKQRHPVPDHLAGRARFVPPTGADMNLWNGVLQNIEHQFQIVSGLAQALGQVSSPPISATEAEIANARLSDRMRGHANAFSAYLSDLASIGLQMEKQAARMERDRVEQMGGEYQGNAIGVAMPDSELKSILVEFDKLPNVHVRVEVNTTEAIRDKLKGQNSVPIFSNPAIMASPFLGTILAGIGYNSNEIREIEEKKMLQQELSPGLPLAPPAPETMGAPQPAGGFGGA